jgi:dolichol-phosphate mannosyltransferase
MKNDENQLKLSVVIPVYNEGMNVPCVIDESVQIMDQQGWVDLYEFLLIDDGSSDNTPEICDQLAEKYGQVKVIHHAHNLGLGAALKTGFTAARGTWVSFISGDGEIGIDQVLNLLKDSGDSDLILSTRERSILWYREFITWGFHVLTRLITGFDSKGMDGIYVIRKEILSQYSLKSTTGLVNLEVLMRSFRKKCRISYGVMVARPRISGKSKVTNLKTISLTFREMYKLRKAIEKEGKSGG